MLDPQFLPSMTHTAYKGRIIVQFPKRIARFTLDFNTKLMNLITPPFSNS